MADNILVIGSGGREHAIVWKLAQSDKIKQIFVLPSSYEINKIKKVEIVSALNVKEHTAIAQWAKQNNVKLVIVGPEDPLADGIADVLLAHNVPCFGPTKAGALIESDKSWAKNFMKEWSIPTALYESFDDVEKAKKFIRRLVSYGLDFIINDKDNRTFQTLFYFYNIV